MLLVDARAAGTATAKATGAGFRRAVVTSSAVVAIAGLSMSLIVPANAATLNASSAKRTTSSHTHARAPRTQSFSVPSTVTAQPSTSRDGYTATSPAVLAAHEAEVAALKEQQLTGIDKKASAIVSILKAPISLIGYSDVAATATAPATQKTVVSDSGTLSDVLQARALDAASATGVEIVGQAVKYVGKVPYVHDGASPTQGFDCSGLVMYVYAKFGIAVPHDVDGIAALGTEVKKSKLEPGDLVVYPHQHIGIYIGAGYMVDAPDVGRDVEVQKVWGSPTYVRIPGA